MAYVVVKDERMGEVLEESDVWCVICGMTVGDYVTPRHPKRRKCMIEPRVMIQSEVWVLSMRLKCNNFLK